jgi:hypothetical protein
MRIWGRRPPLWQLLVAFVLVLAIGVALRAVFSLQVAGGITALLTYVGLMIWIGFSRAQRPR